MSDWILENDLKLTEDSVGLIMPSDFQLSHFWVIICLKSLGIHEGIRKCKTMWDSSDWCLRYCSPRIVHRYLGKTCLTGMEGANLSSNLRYCINTLNSEHLLGVSSVSFESGVSETSVGSICISNYLNLAFM